jgi:Acetyltransferase (GNAT) domain
MNISTVVSPVCTNHSLEKVSDHNSMSCTTQLPRSQTEKIKEYGGGLAIHIARTAQEVEAIRDIWTFWRWNPNADIEFYLHVLRSRPEILRPHVLVLYRGDSPVAMLVGRLVLEQVQTRLGYARWFGTRTRTLTFIYGGQAGDLSHENSRILVSEVMRSLRNGEADLASFRFVRTDSALFKLLTHSPGFFMRDRFPQRQAHLKLVLPRKVDEIYSRLSGKVRKNLRWQAKKLLEEFDGKVRVGCFRCIGELDRMFEDVEQVAGKSYHRGLGFGFVDNLEMRERVRFESEKGWFQAYVLYLADRPAAFWIGNICGGKFYSGFLGYDSEHGRYSPGIFLMTKVFEEFCNEGVDEIDFGLGDAEYKRRFGNCSWDEACIDIFAPTFKGLRINALRTPTLFVDEVMKRSLKKMQILPRIKRLWRDRARKSVQHGSPAA